MRIKEKACAVMVMATVMATSVCTMAAENKIAVASMTTLQVGEKQIDIGAYNIDGYNYFKLRDVAAILNGTEASFEVGYDSTTQSIVLIPNQAYTETGKELQNELTENKTAVVSNQKILLNSAAISMQAYLIDGYNYFQLRDLGEKLGFNIEWDNKNRTISLKLPNSDTPELDVEAKENADVYTTKDLQELIDAKGHRIYLDGIYRGTPGDKIKIDEKTVIYGEDKTIIENITFEIDTDEQVWIEGVVFEGNNETESAVIVENCGTKNCSGIIRCEVRNYFGDAILIKGLAERKNITNDSFDIWETYFYEYGTDKEKQSAAVAVRPEKAMKAHIAVAYNHFHVENESLTNPDYSFITTDTPEFFDEVTVLYENNMVQVGEDFLNDNYLTSIPEENWK